MNDRTQIFSVFHVQGYTTLLHLVFESSEKASSSQKYRTHLVVVFIAFCLSHWLLEYEVTGQPAGQLQLTTGRDSPRSPFSLCQHVGRSWAVLMEKLLLLFPLFTALMGKALSVLQLCAAMTRPPCHSPLRCELMGRPQTRKTDGDRSQMLPRRTKAFLSSVLTSHLLNWQ